MKTILSLLFIAIYSLNISGQCMISDLVAEAYPCDSLGEFLVDVDFNITGGTDTFEVRGNGMSYGFFDYAELPVTIGPLTGDCTTDYEIVVIDADQPECNADTGLGIICCDSTSCNFGEFLVETTNCSEQDQFFLEFDLVENQIESFFVNVNGIEFDVYEDSELPILLGPFEGDCETMYLIEVVDVTNTDCSLTYLQEAICCLDCELTGMEAEATCNEGETTYNLFVNLDSYVGTSDSFELRGNGNNYGTYAYSQLPLTIEDLESDCELEYEFVMVDSENEECNIFVIIEEICCEQAPCELGELLVEYDCNEDEESFDIWINLENYEGVSDSFILRGNGIVYGTYAYGELPVTLFDLLADCETNYEFVIIDSENEACNSEIGIGEVCCGNECGMGELLVEYDCNEDEESFDIWINLENYEGVSDSFILRGNGIIYGTYAYGELPVTLFGLEADCETNYEFVLIDSENEACNSDIGIGEVCCGDECGMGELLVEYDCNEDEESFDIWINLENYEGVSDSFILRGNGIVYGTYAYGELPVTLFGLEADCETNYEFVIIDSENEACNSDIGIGEVCCGDECETSLLQVEYDCNEDEESFDIWINMENYEGVSDSFILSGNGVVYGIYAYGELPVTLFGLEADCETNYEFVIYDSENEACNSGIGIGEVCCGDECGLGELEVEYDCNEEESFDIWINVENYTGVSDSFILRGNGVIYGTYAYGELPVTLIDLVADCETNYEFIIIDSENEACNSEIGIGEVCCGEECALGDLDVEFDCNDDNETFDIWINMENYTGVSDSFILRGNGVIYGTYAYDELPVLLTNLDADCETNYEFVIIDSEDLACSSDIEIGEVCCGIGDCFIGEISIETECTSTTTYNLIFDIEGSMATSDSFDAIFNGINLATFAYNSLPGIIENLPADCDLELNFTIVDSENEACFEEVNMDPVCCEDECEIEIEGLSTIECNEGEVTLVVEFNSTGIEEPGVSLYINDVIVGEAGVDAESIEITGFVSNDPQLGIVICQTENVACCDGINIANPCYVDSVEDELDQIDWKIASNLLALTNNSSRQLNVQVMSYTGVILAKRTVNTNNESLIDMCNVPAGLYLLHMINDKGQRTEKFVVR